VQPFDSGSVALTTGFEDSSAAVETALAALDVKRVRVETYVLADGTRARTWVGAVEAGRLLNFLWYGLVVRIHSDRQGTQVIVDLLGAAELGAGDLDRGDLLLALTRALAEAKA
jgi:hypothetical protein